MAKCHYRAQTANKKDFMAAEQKSRDCSRVGGEENDEHLSTEAEEVPEMEGAGDVEGDVPTK